MNQSLWIVDTMSPLAEHTVLLSEQGCVRRKGYHIPRNRLRHPLHCYLVPGVSRPT